MSIWDEPYKTFLPEPAVLQEEEEKEGVKTEQHLLEFWKADPSHPGICLWYKENIISTEFWGVDAAAVSQ